MRLDSQAMYDTTMSLLRAEDQKLRREPALRRKMARDGWQGMGHKLVKKHVVFLDLAMADSLVQQGMPGLKHFQSSLHDGGSLPWLDRTVYSCVHKVAVESQAERWGGVSEHYLRLSCFQCGESLSFAAYDPSTCEQYPVEISLRRRHEMVETFMPISEAERYVNLQVAMGSAMMTDVGSGEDVRQVIQIG